MDSEKIIRSAILLFFTLVTLSTKGQVYTIAEEDYENVSFTQEIHKDISKYVGVYTFGMSESETLLVINTHGNEVVAQIRSFEWIMDSNYKTNGYKHIFQTLSNVRIKNGRLISDELEGQFVNVKEKNFSGSALLTERVSYKEIVNLAFGFKSESLDDYYSGDYQFASYRLLSKEELMTYSKEELRIMRNEIFARYEYDFKSGGEMEKYFENQEWYNPNNKDVASLLTDFEIKNIKLIRSLE
ncbi:hypothetical protein FUAX_42770 (plasmid) [Fulvitalea axinellae]|uniref:YARHG domain-containing protein n=1 Tax=Fulvitalea axinellae TaxID=1182444 RepID=A0AAU9DKQ6_9BACT|nr:hypothetical protein FUAX_42770 [Fulvitalea axinellae]